MKKALENYAFIDSQNLNLGVREQGWELDFRRFRVYLREKYGVAKAYLFFGYMSEHEPLYQNMRHFGYELVFKPVVRMKNNEVKGNVDAELVLQAMIDYQKYAKAVIVTGDGDFYCLVKYLYEQGKLLKLMIPNRLKYSKLLNKTGLSIHDIMFMNQLRHLLNYKKQHPR
jgi:uncharacterized LabA/DUF88 family protein